ncbi:hypothetical protein L2E82_29741 [Cichorium intybus]|uniref:Uncharacterized protein n=1 Tax=Cichorium intybus TaxID=13427 RepID=A0ACB9CYU1_CICIN|nr:hypothetical protein L2E82_29741 [Cichorium intybus]
MLEKNYSGRDVLDLTMSLGKFHDSEGTFGRSSAITSRTHTRPDEWWKLFGGDTPILQRFTIRILSQTASLKVDKRSYDPIDYECIDNTDFWVVEEEPEGELGYNDLENMLDDQEHGPASQMQEKESEHTLDDAEDDSEFLLLSDRELNAYNTPMSQNP